MSKTRTKGPKLPSLSMWKTAKKRSGEEGPGFDEYPDARYVWKITGAERAQSANGRSQINWTLMFADGEFEGKEFRDYQGIETEDNLVYAMNRLERLGHEVPDSPKELDETLKEIVEAELEVRGRLKSKGEFQNLWLDGIVGEEEGGETEEGEAGGEEAEIEEGSTVTLTSEKNKTEYTVDSVDGDTVSIKDDDGEEYEVEASDCVLVESEEEEKDEGGEEGEIEEESTVTLTSEKNKTEYTVTSVDDDTVSIKDEEDEEYEVPLADCNLVESEEDEGGEDDENAVEVGVGDRVAAKNKKGDQVEGEIKRISRDGTKVSIEDDEGTVHRGIPVENVMGEPPEEPKKTPKGKTVKKGKTPKGKTAKKKTGKTSVKKKTGKRSK